MKTFKKVIIGAFALLLASAVHTSAIENLAISVKCRNVILSWPSDEFSGETYIVQYRPDLTSTNPWTTLTNYMPADAGTNLTFFVHSNIVEHPNCSGSAPGSMMARSANPLTPAQRAAARAQRLAQFTNDLAWLLPPQPVTRSKRMPLKILSSAGTSSVASSGTASGEANGPQPPGGGGSGGGSTVTPETGFYRVVRNGAHLWALTNGTTLSAIVTIPVEAGNDGGTLETVTFQANSTSILGVEPLEPPFSLLSFKMDTTRLNNGDNYLVAEAVWNMNTNVDLNADDWPDFVKLQSSAVQVVVSNEISFPNWVDEFGGGSMSFDVISIYPDADWQIDIYDSQTNYAGSFSDHTTDGHIHVVWGVTNSQGTPLTDNVFYSATTVTYASGGGTTSVRKPNPRKIRVVDNYPPVGKWIVAWQYIFQDNPETYKNEAPPQPNMLNSIFTAYGAGQMGGGMIQPLGTLPGTFQPLHVGTNYTTTQKAEDWTQFKIALTNLNARNLYYFGHGNSEALGGTKDPNRTLTSKAVGILLRYDDANPTNRHFFRYVFLDGCNSANGSFPTKFGIPKREHVPYSDYLGENNVRPRAFSGWTDYKQFAVLGYIPWQFPGYRINFWSYWFLNNRELYQAHEDARISIGANGMAIGQSLKIYGYENMRAYDFNTQ